MLKTRVGTALVGLPIVIYMFVWGSIPMQLALVSVVAYACAHELSGFLVARCVNEFHLSDQEELSLFKFLRSFRIGLILFLAMFFVLFLNLPRLTAPVLLVGAMSGHPVTSAVLRKPLSGEICWSSPTTTILFAM